MFVINSTIAVFGFHAFFGMSRLPACRLFRHDGHLPASGLLFVQAVSNMSSRLTYSAALLGSYGPRAVQMAAMLAVAAGVGIWGALLLAPAPQEAPPVLSTEAAPGQDLAPVSNWFGGGTARLRVEVAGLISGQNGAALLSINGGPAQAYRVGQTLAQGVTLAAVGPQGVSIEQDGIAEEVTIPALPFPPKGFVPAGS